MQNPTKLCRLIDTTYSSSLKYSGSYLGVCGSRETDHWKKSNFATFLLCTSSYQINSLTSMAYQLSSYWATRKSPSCSVPCQYFTFTFWCRYWQPHCWTGGGSVPYGMHCTSISLITSLFLGKCKELGLIIPSLWIWLLTNELRMAYTLYTAVRTTTHKLVRATLHKS